MNRKRKILSIQVLIFFVAISLIFFTYVNENGEKVVKKTEVKPNFQVEEESQNEDDKQSNTFENVEYKGIDLEGNRYVIKAEKANFSSDKPELIYMEVMNTIFYFKDGTTLKVEGDYGTYNNKTNDMQFRNNIIAKYLDAIMYADNLDYLNTKNLLSIYGNVLGESIKGDIIADNLEFNIINKTLDISMFSEERVNIKVRDQ